MVVHAVIPALMRVRQEDCHGFKAAWATLEIKAILNYIVRCHLKKEKREIPLKFAFLRFLVEMFSFLSVDYYLCFLLSVFQPGS